MRSVPPETDPQAGTATPTPRPTGFAGEKTSEVRTDDPRRCSWVLRRLGDGWPVTNEWRES